MHFAQIEPNSAWGVSSTVPFFGSLTATPTTAMLHAPPPEPTWIYEIDRKDRVVRCPARERRASAWTFPSTPCTARWE